MTDAGIGAATAPRSIPAQARALWIVYHDFTGLPRSKVVSIDRLDEVLAEGVSFNKANWDVDITGTLVPGSPYGADSGDFWAVPDPTSLTLLPHRPGVAQAFAWLRDEQGPWSGDPRATLQAQTSQLQQVGLRVRVGLEVEFTVIDPTRPPEPGRAGSTMFALAEIDRTWAYWDAVLAALDGIGVRLHQLGREYGDGQFEISLLPADPIASCDQLLLARQLIKSLARDHGLMASFMPKPRVDQPGNGLHVHLSLTDATGADRMTDAGHPDMLSRTASDMIAGLLKHAPAQAALGCSTVNSFRRLRPGSWAPAHVSWGVGNRGVLVRVPSREAPIHIEYRAGDASSNLYLHVAGLLAATLDGLATSPVLPPATGGEVLTWTDDEATAHGVDRLPTCLDEALEALRRDAFMRDALGPAIVDHLLLVKANEAAAYAAQVDSAAARNEVSAWETANYFEAL